LEELAKKNLKSKAFRLHLKKAHESPNPHNVLEEIELSFKIKKLEKISINGKQDVWDVINALRKKVAFTSVLGLFDITDVNSLKI